MREVEGWGGYVAPDGSRLDGLKVKFSVDGTGVEWPKDGQCGRNVSKWMALSHNSVKVTFTKDDAEVAEEEAGTAAGLDLAEWKQKARIRFVLQHSNEPSMLHVTCQALFELSGVEKDNVAAWPGSRDKPEVVPAICLKRTGLPSTSFAVR